MLNPAVKFKSIQTKLFVTYSLLIVCIVAILSYSFYYYTSNILTQNASESLYRSSSSLSSQLDSEFKFMDSTAVKLIFSKTLKDLFFNGLAQDRQEEAFHNARKMNEIVYSIMGPAPLGWQINMFDETGKFYGTGNNSTSMFFPTDKMKNLSWAEETIDLAGGKHISIPHTDDWTLKGQRVISLSRMFMLDLGSEEQGILEIQQSYQMFSKMVQSAMADSSGTPSPGLRIFIMNDRGQQIYPLQAEGSSSAASSYWKQARAMTADSGTLNCRDPINGQQEICVFTHSITTGWTVIASQSKSLQLEPVKNFRDKVVAAELGLLLVILIVSFYVAKGLTTPIKAIHSSIRALSIENLLPTSSKESTTGLNELEQLDISFRRMCLRLKGSIEEALLSRSKEMQARMMALQAQINPHFLYNTITNISVMAEERGQPEIVKVCKNLTRMFRYILSNNNEQASIKEELGYAENYLSLMQIRYTSLLTYSIDVSEEVQSVRIPKLIVQPLIENCIKHGIHIKPPWRIHLNGKCEGNRWTIEIRDNGTGFTDDALDTVRSGQKREGEDEDTGIGMGLANISERLRLLYGKHAIFQISNHPEGGASVLIGGSIETTEISEGKGKESA
jgi:two-component system sensor histidine kinase YesM